MVLHNFVRFEWHQGELLTCRAYEIILGTVLGALLGWVARKVMKFAERKKLIDRQSFVAQYISLAVLSNGASQLDALCGAD